MHKTKASLALFNQYLALLINIVRSGCVSGQFVLLAYFVCLLICLFFFFVCVCVCQAPVNASLCHQKEAWLVCFPACQLIIL